jgi:uncharacterized protein (TIGR03066 family)
MNRSRLSLLVVLLGIAAAASGQPEPAPPPTTTAELLVGRWKVIRNDGNMIPAHKGISREFKKDGTFTTQTMHADGPRKTTGAYRVVGRNLELKYDPPHFPAEGQVRIVKVTPTELVIQAGKDANFRIDESIRDTGK